MRPKREEYKKSVQLKFRYCPEYHNTSLSFDYMHTGGGDTRQT